ncbi:hypothetical protein JCM11491_000727 [Sporobolomyces phaffii]
MVYVLPLWSFNLAVSIAAAPLAVLLAFVLLYIVTHPRFTKTPLHSKRPLTVTQHNTLLNRHENGGTGVWSRKWRRKVAAALAMSPVRRGLGDLDDPDDDDGDDGDSDGAGAGSSSSGSESWTVKVRPAPDGLRGCLKRERSFELSQRPVAAPEPPEAPPLPSPAASQSSSTSSSFYSPPLPPPSPPPEPTLEPPVVKAKKKSVSIQEPSLVELELLRSKWDSEEMQSSVNGGNGFGGIAGYRRTRDYFNKSASTPPPRAPAPAPSSVETLDAKLRVKATATTLKEEAAPTTRGGDEKENRPRRPLNSSLAGAGSNSRSSSTSLSPSPITRRPVSKRALSPNAITVGAGTRRRGVSPSNPGALGGGSGTSRSASNSPTASSTGDRAQPRWIKTKKTNKSSTLRPTLDEDDDDAAENGTERSMSAIVSDEEDDVEGDEYEDVPPTPPPRQAALVPAPSHISPSLELLLHHTNQSLARDAEKRRNYAQVDAEDDESREPRGISPPRSSLFESTTRPSSSTRKASHPPHPPSDSLDPPLSLAPPATARPQSQPAPPSLEITPASPVVPLSSLPPIPPLISDRTEAGVASPPAGGA